jgi:DNA repair exonuclease SbcCD ATPase subunit
MDRIRSQVDGDLAGLQTSSGRIKSGGRWAEAENAVQALSHEVEEVAKTVASLRTDLDERRRLQSALAALGTPEADKKRRADLAEAEVQLQKADGQAQELETAQTHARLARLQADSAEEEALRTSQLWAEVEAAQAAQGAAAQALQAKSEAARQAQAASQTAQEAARATQAHALSAQNTLRQIEMAVQATKAKAERIQLADLIQRVETADAERITQRALAAHGPDTKIVTQIETLAREVTTARAVRDAAAPKVSVRYAAGARPVLIAGTPLQAEETRRLPQDGQITLPGIGEMHVDTANRDTVAAFTRAQEALSTALTAGGWADITALHAAARSRASAELAAELAEKTVVALAPGGLDQLRLRLAGLPENDPPQIADLPPRAEAEAAFASATTAHDTQQAQALQLSDLQQATALAAAKAETVQEGAAERLRLARQAVAGLPAPDPAQETARVAKLRATATAAQQAFIERKAQAPDLEGLRARRARIQSVIQSTAQEASRMCAQIGRLDGRIETRGDEGVEESLEDLRGQLMAAQERRANVGFDKDVLVRLLTALDGAHKAARETYFAPIAAELRPLLADLWDDAELHWSDDTLLPVALVRKGTQETLDVLSGGTQEQIAFLVRLAFARLLAKSGRHAPLILDDALVYSDDDRIERMFDALHGAAADLQIIVLSCRQRAFRDLGAPSLGFTPVVGAS